jgi:hypothetical protein
MNTEGITATGGCYCGKVRFRARLAETEVTECHCSQCRKQAGHRNASIDTKAVDVEIDGAGDITWYRASAVAERGFCKICGSHLFWRLLDEDDDELSIQAASFDAPTGLRVARHIFVESKGDYYEIDDGLPQFVGYDKPAGDEEAPG